MSSALSSILSTVGPVPDGPFLVALGGGADSAVAAAVVNEVSSGQGVRLIHFDHRTDSSPLLADAAVELAAYLDLKLEMHSLDIETSGSWETMARDARRCALRDAVIGSEVIVTGHHRDDVAETLIGHIVRGSGARGLSSLRSRNGNYWRPLLGVSRPEVRHVAALLGLPYADDPSNADIRYRRNRIRHEIIPTLGTINPKVGEALARTAAHLGEDDAELEAHAAAVPIKQDREAWVAPLPVLRTLSTSISARVVARLVRSARPPYGPSAEELVRIRDVIMGSARRTELAGGLVVEIEGPMLALYRPDDSVLPPKPVELVIPGETLWGDFCISANTSSIPLRGVATTNLDADDVGSSLVIRSADHGERLAIRSGSKLVRDALAEAGVPVRKRAGWPVVATHGKIVWIVGVRASVWAKARSTTKRYLVLSSEG